MIRALLLIFDGAASWEKIAKAQRGFLFILCLHLLPLMVLTLGVEAYALTRLGEGRTITGKLIIVQPQAALTYAGVSAALILAVVVSAARILQRVGRSFHNSLSYLQCLRVIGYGVSPLLLAHLLDALPSINTWVCFGLGIALTIVVLYLGVPHVLRPDPAKAMGIYLLGAVVLLVLSGLAHFLAVQILHGEFNARFWEQFVQ
ncbi:MAG: YIP1 family protein [Verrucomicrobia bacterium]|nr:YIP1 family protein [Verrucomicrobiota bacterium]